MFIVLLSFSISLATKCLFLNDELCMVRPTLIYLNSVELKYYPFIIRLVKRTGSCNVLSPKICVPKENHMGANKNEAKIMTKHISCDGKYKLNSTKCNSNEKWNNNTCKCECKNYHKRKKDCRWNPSTCICENSKYL